MLFSRLLGRRDDSESASPDLDKPVEISSRYNPNRYSKRGDAGASGDNSSRPVQDKSREVQSRQAAEQSRRDDGDKEAIPRHRGEVTIADKETIKYSPSRSADVARAFQHPKRNYSNKGDGDWASQPQRSKSLFIDPEREEVEKENDVQITPGPSPTQKSVRPVRAKALLPQPKQPASFKPPVSFKAKTLSSSDIKADGGGSSRSSSNQFDEYGSEGEEASSEDPLDESSDLDVASHPSAIVDDNR